MSCYMYNYLTLEFICAKDENIGHSVTYDIKKRFTQLEINILW